MTDATAKTLFDQEPPLERHIGERKLRRQVTVYLYELKEMVQSGQLSETALSRKLQVLDQWLCTRLSGTNVLALAKEIEIGMPEWVPYMPRTIGSRYEELRVARIWSALLNPQALSLLSTAIAQERSLDEEEDFI